MTKSPLTIEALLVSVGAEMDLSLAGPAVGLTNVVHTPELNRPGLAFAGFYEVFSHDRLQILGNTEISYLNSLAPAEREARMRGVMQFRMPCLIVTNAHEIPDGMVALSREFAVPVLRTSLPTTRLMSLLNTHLEHHFAPMETVHGNLLDIFGVGVLIMGKSSVGKSECALELIERGHRLVADDIVVLRRYGKSDLIGRSSDTLKYHMEIRGLGILNIEKMFGVASVVEEKRVDIVVGLENWNDSVDYERLGLDDQFQPILEVEVPKYLIPVQPGRNISIMVEMAALNHRLKSSGYNPAQQFNEHLMALMQQSGDKPA